MHWIWIILAGFVTLILLLLFVPLRLGINVRIKGLSNRASLSVGLFWGLLPIKIELRIARKKGEGFSLLRKKRRGWEEITSLKRIIGRPEKKKRQELVKRLFKRIRVKKAFLSLEFGTNDAGQTAIIYGAVCSLVNTASAIIETKNRRIKRSVYIKPFFNSRMLDFKFSCIVSFQLVHIITAFKNTNKPGKE